MGIGDIMCLAAPGVWKQACRQTGTCVSCYLLVPEIPPANLRGPPTQQQPPLSPSGMFPGHGLQSWFIYGANMQGHLNWVLLGKPGASIYSTLPLPLISLSPLSVDQALSLLG